MDGDGTSPSAGKMPALPGALPRALRLAALILGVLTIFGLADSPTFHCDYQRTGRSQDAGPARPRLFWTFRTGASIAASPVIASDGTIYLAATDGQLLALSAQGSRNWEFQAEESLFATPSLDASGRLYFGDLAGWFYSLAADGTLRWKYRLSDGTDNRILGSPAVTPEGVSFVAAWNNGLYSFSPDGNLRWRARLNGLPTSAPALDDLGNIYIACLDSFDPTYITVHKLAPTSSVPLWSSRQPLGTGSSRVISTPAIDTARGRLYVGACTATAGVVIALDLSGGEVVFRKPLPKGILSSPAVRDDGVILVGCLDGRLYALDPETGAEHWVFQADAPYVFGSPIVDRIGNVYVGDSDGTVYSISREGTRLWQLISDSNIESAPVVHAGRLYVTSFDSCLYVVGTNPIRRPRDRQRP
jgi:outer membrane protein assembly factor BamB